MFDAVVAAVVLLVATLTEVTAALSSALYLLFELLVEAVVSLWSFFQRRGVSRTWKLVVGTAISLATVGIIAFLWSSVSPPRTVPPELSLRPGEGSQARLTISVRLGNSPGQRTSPEEVASPAETRRRSDVPDGEAIAVPSNEEQGATSGTRSRIGQVLKNAADRFTRRHKDDEPESKPVE